MTETDQIDVKQVSLVAGPEMQGLFGRGDEYARLVEDGLRVRFVVRDGKLTISGSEASVALAEQLVGELVSMARQGREVGSQEVRLALRHFSQKTEDTFREVQAELIDVSPKKRSVRPKGAKQAQYIQAVRENDIVIGIGPAGTGKTYLAMAMAVSALLHKQVSRIILTRPAVEAGEKLGYLPGTLTEKINPYLRPLYDALYDM
ncbi:MAG: PhoH family protein, partial [candidate division NC10 bacterium]